MREALSLFSIFLFFSAVSSAQPSPAGGEFQVNTYTSGFQSMPDVAMEADGDFVVVWESSNQDGDDGSIQGQRFASDGAGLGSEFQVNTFTTGPQYSPVVASDPTGNFVVAWTDFGSLKAQRFASDGTAVGGELNIAAGFADVAASASGFVVAWDTLYSFDYSYARTFAWDGTPLSGALMVNTTKNAFGASVASDADGNFIVVWDDFNLHRVRGQRFAFDGTFLGDELQIDSYTAVVVNTPDVASDAAGNFVVVWRSDASDGDGSSIRGQRIAANGTFLGGEFQVNSYTTGNQNTPVIASDEDGDLVAVWAGPDGDQSGIRGQRFTPAPSADVAVTKDDGVDAVLPGTQLVYTIVAANFGPSFADPVAVTDTFPGELTCSWTSVAAGGASGNSDDTGDLSDDLTMPAGSSVTYTVTCDVAIDATGTLSNTATVSSALPDPLPGNNSATDDDTMLRIADLSVAQSDAPDPVVVDMDVAYSIEVTNAGPGSAADVRVTVILPSSAAFAGVAGASWICNGSGTIVICGLANLDVGAAPTLTVTATAPSSPGTLLEQAIVSAVDLDPNPDDNSSVETTTVIPVPIFLDGFESGDTTAWSATVPP